jgi:hypothetical protein
VQAPQDFPGAAVIVLSRAGTPITESERPGRMSLSPFRLEREADLLFVSRVTRGSPFAAGLSARRVVSADSAAMVNGASGRPTAPAKTRVMTGSKTRQPLAPFQTAESPHIGVTVGLRSNGWTIEGLGAPLSPGTEKPGKKTGRLIGFDPGFPSPTQPTANPVRASRVCKMETTAVVLGESRARGASLPDHYRKTSPTPSLRLERMRAISLLAAVSR